MAVAVRQPRLLNENGWTEKGRLRPSAAELHLKLNGISYGVLTMGWDDEALPIRAWVEMYTLKGSAGLYRINRADSRRFQTCAYTVQHAIDTLNDSLWREQGDFTGNAEAFLRKLLSFQNKAYWQLGTCEDTDNYKLTGINYNKLSDMLTEFVESRTGYYLTYDFSTWPWTVNWKRLPAGVRCEWRVRRNVRSCSVTTFDTEQCTRLYYTVTPAEGQEADPTIHVLDDAEAQQHYGVIERAISISAEDVANPAAFAAQFLQDHAEPGVQINVEGYEFYKQTGDSLDSYDVGDLARCIVGGIGGPLRERIVVLNYPDLIGTPESVSGELANSLPKFSESLATASKTAAAASRSARASARAVEKQEKEITHWSQVVTYHGNALDETGITAFYESGIDMDATGGVKIYSLEEGIQALYAAIQVNSKAIDAKVGSDALQGLLHIDQLSTALGNVMQGPDGGTIGAYVATAINAQTGQGIVQITGDKVNITGLVTMTQLESVEGKIDTVRSETITANTYLSAATGKFNTLWVESAGANGATNTAQVNNAVNGIYEYQPTEEGKIGFQFTTLANPNRQSINFNIADTAYYKSHVGIDPTKLVLQEIGATPYNASTADEITGITAGTDPKYFLITATPKDGDTVYKKFILPAASAPAVTTDPKISKKSWASGQIQLDASSDPNDPASVTIKLTGGPTGSLDSAASPTKISFDILESVNGSTVDTGADVVATVTRQAATLKLGTNSDNEPAIVANTPGKATVGGQVIQVGVTALKVTPGTATPNTPTWNSTTHKYAITADGSVSIGSDSLALTRGSLSGDFSPTHAFTYGFNECFNSVELTAAKTTINPGETVDVIPKMKGTWDASTAQAFSEKKLTITAAPAATVTPKVSKKTWSSSGTLTFEGTTASSDPTSAGVALGWMTVPNTSNGNAALSVVDKASPYSSAQPYTVLEKNLTLTCEDDAAYLKDGGTTLAKVPNNKTISASIDSIALRTAGGVQYVYDDVERKFTAYLKATGTNVAEKTGEVDIPAASAIEHGKRLVSAVLAETASSAAAPSTLVSGKTYNLYRVVDGTRESAALAAYTVPEASTPSTGSTRYVLNLDPLTLTAEDAANISQNSPLIKTTLASYTDGIKEKDRPIEISVNAWEIYQAGINQGMNGVVNVVKGPWSTSGNTSTVTLTPSAGQGSSATVQVEKVPVENYSSAYGYVNLMDGSERISSIGLRLVKSSDGSYVSLFYGASAAGGMNGSISDIIYGGMNKTELARIDVNGTAGGESTISVLKSIGDITLTDADVGTSVKYPLLTYQDGTKLNDGVNQIPVTVDASAVYLKGQSDGSNVQIEPVRSYGTAATNHKLYTIQPSGNNSVMAAAEIYVDVPDGVKSITKLSSALEASTYNGWTAELGALSMSYPYAYCYATGENGKRYNFKIDASEVYNLGMSAAAGGTLQEVKNLGTIRSSQTLNVTPDDGAIAMKKVTAYIDVPKVKNTEAVGEVLPGSHTVTPTGSYDAMKAVTFTVPSVTGALAGADNIYNPPGVQNVRLGHQYKVEVKFGNTVMQTIYFRCVQ